MSRKSVKIEIESDEIDADAEVKIRRKSNKVEEVMRSQNHLMAPDGDDPFDDEEKNIEGDDGDDGDKGEDGRDTMKKKDRDGHRHKIRKMKDLSIQSGRLTWEEAEQLLRENEHAGLRKVRELRHVAFPYHQITNIPKAVKYICDAQVGKFRRQVKGIVLAVGSISDVKAIRVVDDQNVFHCDVFVEQIIFRPTRDMKYEAVVTMISNRIITAKLFNQINITCLLDSKAESVLRGITINAGDTILVNYQSSTVKRGIAVLNGNLVRLVKKGSGEDSMINMGKQSKDDNKTMKRKIKDEVIENEDKPKKAKSKKISFEESDDPESE